MNEIQKLRHELGMSQSQFAKYFNIPVRTIQDWEVNKRKPTVYLVELMKIKIKYDKLSENS